MVHFPPVFRAQAPNTYHLFASASSQMSFQETGIQNLHLGARAAVLGGAVFGVKPPQRHSASLRALLRTATGRRGRRPER